MTPDGAAPKRWRLPTAITSRSARQVGTLLTGTVLSQAVPLLATPLLTRQYSPSDFGIFAVFMAGATLLALIAGFRYQLAIIVPADRKEGAELTRLTILLAVPVAVLATVAWLVTLFTLPEREIYGFQRWGALLGPSVLFASVQVSLYSWRNRNSDYAGMARSKVAMWGVATFAQVLLGWLLPSAESLIAGLVAGQFACVLYLWARSRDLWSSREGVAPGLGRTLLRRYSRFPQFSLAADLVNQLANQLPIFVMSRLVGAAPTGNLSLTNRTLSAPISFLGTSVLDVFQRRAAEDLAQQGHCRGVFLRTLRILVLLAIIPFVALLVLAPTLFALVFGAEWEQAGEFARLLAPLFFLRFIVSPLSYVLYIAEKQAQDLAWQICLLATTGAALAWGASSGSAYLAVALFSATYSVMYLVYLALAYVYSGGDRTARATAVLPIQGEGR